MPMLPKSGLMRVRLSKGDKMQQKAPGPKGLPFLGSVYEIRKNPLDFFVNAQKKYGDVVLVKMGPLNVYMVSHPDGIKYVLQDNPKNYHKSPLYERMKSVVGKGLITSEDELWRRQRKLAQPAFHQQKIMGMLATMTEQTSQMLKQWDGSSLNIEKEMMQLTGSIIVKTMFGRDLDGAAVIEKSWNTINEWIGKRFWTLTNVSAYFPTLRNIRFRKNLKALEGFLKNTIQKRLTSDEQHDDLLSMLLEARDEETHQGMNNQQLRDEMMTIFIAGHETTALALSWTLHLLAQHPNVLKKLQTELDQILINRTPVFSDISQLKYTRMVLEESMRLYPPVWGIGREALADDEICGYTVPKKSVVFLLQYVTHRRTDLWPEPDKFDPERFSPDNSKDRHRFAYFPFGGGPRICIGNAFAMMEATAILAMICQHYELKPIENATLPQLHPLVSLRSKNGIFLNPQRRAA